MAKPSITEQKSKSLSPPLSFSSFSKPNSLPLQPKSFSLSHKPITVSDFQLPLFQYGINNTHELHQYVINLQQKCIDYYFQQGNGTISKLITQINKILGQVAPQNGYKWIFNPTWIVKNTHQIKIAEKIWNTDDKYFTNKDYKKWITATCKKYKDNQKPLICINQQLVKIKPDTDNISSFNTNKNWHVRILMALYLPKSKFIWYKIADVNNPNSKNGQLFKSSLNQIANDASIRNSIMHSSMIFDDTQIKLTDRQIIGSNDLFPLNPGMFLVKFSLICIIIMIIYSNID